MYGTTKQINWANDIIVRVNRFKGMALIVESHLDDELSRVLNKALKRAEYINKEQDAKAIINWYGYIGLETVAGRRKYRESIRKFLVDLLDVDDIAYVDEIVKIGESQGIWEN